MPARAWAALPVLGSFCRRWEGKDLNRGKVVVDWDDRLPAQTRSSKVVRVCDSIVVPPVPGGVRPLIRIVATCGRGFFWGSLGRFDAVLAPVFSLLLLLLFVFVVEKSLWYMDSTRKSA